MKLSKIFEWYLQDFGGSHEKLKAWIEAQGLGQSLKGKDVVFAEYDWALNQAQ